MKPFEPGETDLLPLFPLHTVLFPHGHLPLHIFEPRYRMMIGRCIEECQPFGVLLIRRGREVGGGAEPFEVGTLAEIVGARPLPDGRYEIPVPGDGEVPRPRIPLRGGALPDGKGGTAG